MSNEVSIFQNQTGVSTRRSSALAEQLKSSSTDIQPPYSNK
jgi:hypothetical protein